MKQKIQQLNTSEMTSKEIAISLGRNPSTVRSYLDKFHIPYKKKFSRVKKIETGAKGELFNWSLFTNDIMFLS